MPISGYFQFSNINSFGILSDSGSRHVVDTVVAVVILVVAQAGGATDFGLKVSCLIGKSLINGPFSIAMLVYPRVKNM